MLDYSLLQNKAKIKLKNRFNDQKEEPCLDLLSNNFKTTFGDCKIYIVEKYYVARPDLVSLAVYKTDKYADIICKVNGISNPFELQENMIIAVPNEENILEALRYNDFTPSELIEDNDNIKKKEISIQKKKDEERSSNELLAGDSNFIIDRTNNIIFY